MNERNMMKRGTGIENFCEREKEELRTLSFIKAYYWNQFKMRWRSFLDSENGKISE